MPGASHQIPSSLVLSQIARWRWSLVSCVNALLCTMYEYMFVHAFKCLSFTHTCIYSLSLFLSLSLFVSLYYTCTHTQHKYLDTHQHSSDELNDTESAYCPSFLHFVDMDSCYHSMDGQLWSTVVKAGCCYSVV